jgi:hypothetical protein
MALRNQQTNHHPLERALPRRRSERTDTTHPGQKPFKLTPALRAKVLAATRRKPKDGSTHWSCRKLAAELGISKDLVHRIWQEAGVRPHRLERYMASPDPDFESKAADIIGLYLQPPKHAAIFCVDEKTAIQALDRLDSVLPLSPGRAERHGFEYYRPGTLSLTPLWIPRQERYTVRQPSVTRARSSSPFWSRSFNNVDPVRKFTSSWITCRRIKRSSCKPSWRPTPMFVFISRLPILPGLTK